MGKKVGGTGQAVIYTGNLPGNPAMDNTQTRIVQTSEDRPDLSLPMARVDAVVPYIVGMVRVTQPNFIWYGNVKNIWEETEETVTETIKDVIVESSFVSIGQVAYRYVETTTVTRKVVGYSIDAALAICLGPGSVLRAIYAGKEKIWEGSLGAGRHEVTNTGNIPVLGSGFIYNSGEFTQTPDPYLAQFVPVQNLPGYVGIAYIILKQVNAADLSGASYSFEVQRVPDRLALGADNQIGEDLNPASVAADVILNNWGSIGVQPDFLDFESLEAAAAQFKLDGLASSFVSYSENFGISLLNSVNTQTRSVVYVDPDSAQIRMKPLRSLAFDESAAIHLNNSNTQSVQSMEKEGWQSLPTHMKVSFDNRVKDYDNDYIMSINPAITPLNDRSRRVGETNVNPAKTQAAASATLSLMLTYESAPQLSFTVQANRVADDILPGEPFLVSWDEYGLENFPVFASKIAEQGSTSNYVKVTCQQYEATQVDDFFSLPEASQHVSFDLSPQPTTGGFIIQTPFYFLANTNFEQDLSLMDDVDFPFVLPKPANEYQLTFDVNIGGGASLRQDIPFSAFAKFAHNLKKYTDVSDYITDSVTIYDVTDPLILMNQGIDGVRSGNRFIITPFEIMSFETFTDNSDGTYTLNTVHRALLDTNIEAHFADDELAIIDSRKARMLQYKTNLGQPYTFAFYSRSHQGLTRTPGVLNYEPFIARAFVVNSPVLCAVNSITNSSAVVEPGEEVTFSYVQRPRSRDVLLALDPMDTDALNPEITDDEMGVAVFLVDAAQDFYLLGTSVLGDNFTGFGVGDPFESVFTIPPTASPGSAVVFFHGARMITTTSAPFTNQTDQIREQSFNFDLIDIYIKDPLDIVSDFVLDYAINP